MKKALLIVVFAMMSLSFFSCSKSGVKPNNNIIPPDTSKGGNTVTVNKTTINNLLLSSYALLDGVDGSNTSAPWATTTDNWIYGSVAGGDAHRGSVATDQPLITNIAQYSASPTVGFFDEKWQVNILGIHYANAVLSNIPMVKDGSLSTADIKELTAEARFLRGFYELELAKLWRNVPYIDETVPYNNGYSNISNTAPVWDKIEADFTAAMNTLPNTQSHPGYPNKYAAEAFLAKTYMFDHKYTLAQPLLTDLISNGVTSTGTKYSLGHYSDNFNPSTKNGPEGVFVIQATIHDNSNGVNGNAGDVFNFPAGGPAQCCGFFQPSFSFVNAFKTDPVTGLPLLDTYNNTDLKNDMKVDASASFTPTTTTVDARLDWSVGRRGIPYLDWGIMPGVSWVRDQYSGGPYVNIKTVYYQSAQSTTSDTYLGWAANESTTNGYNAIRFADVLLWAAEAAVETGNLQQAEDYVNMVRKRAADPTGWVHSYIDPSNPAAGFTSIPAANYYVGLYGAAGGYSPTGFTAGGQAYARKAVYFERMIELGMEGHRFFDLQRWDASSGGPAGGAYMANALKAYVAHEKAVPNASGTELYNAVFTAGKNEIYPIPQNQIDLTGGKLKQNAGY